MKWHKMSPRSSSIVFFAYACIYYPIYNMWLVYATLSFSSTVLLKCFTKSPKLIKIYYRYNHLGKLS